jgi:hypothetical protein
MYEEGKDFKCAVISPSPQDPDLARVALRCTPLNDDARHAFLAVQHQINRIRIGLELGPPLPLTGVIDASTYLAAVEIATSAKTVRPQGRAIGITALESTPLKNFFLLGRFRPEFWILKGKTAAENRDRLRQNSYMELVTFARSSAAIFGIVADAIWYSTLTDIPPFPPTPPSPTPPPAKSSKVPIVAASAVGLAIGAALIFAILQSRLQ